MQAMIEELSGDNLFILFPATAFLLFIFLTFALKLILCHISIDRWLNETDMDFFFFFLKYTSNMGSEHVSKCRSCL